jgi:hypothetical protein
MGALDMAFSHLFLSKHDSKWNDSNDSKSYSSSFNYQTGSPKKKKKKKKTFTFQIIKLQRLGNEEALKFFKLCLCLMFAKSGSSMVYV